KSARDTLQLFAAQAADNLAKRWCFDDGAELLDVAEDMLAHRLELRRFGRVHPAANPDPARRDLEVQTGALMLWQPSTGKNRGNVRLERPLVVGETRVPIDPVE